ncbi:hypothetical protein ACFQ48_21475 [Hymenobacter caeli]|uniref:Uncharacterized protein n=1 Tax=Hymenobacter caeli TaxID=2735894 RepID=A0ABX2FW85_9BACT|nr:hypothetical protein [Hymenobacter caeli]NRT21488.1 hypothetical protein [Hymenobacter caeli]
MKIVKIAAVLALVVALCADLCNAAHAQQTIDIKQIGLRNGRVGATTALYLGQNSEAAIRVLGNPTKTGKEFIETQEGNADVFYYKSNRLYFVKDTLVGFDLRDESLVIGETIITSFGVNYKIANTPRQIAKDTQRKSPHFINSSRILVGFVWGKNPGETRNQRYSSKFFGFLFNGPKDINSWLEILFDDSGEVINVVVGAPI